MKKQSWYPFWYRFATQLNNPVWKLIYRRLTKPIRFHFRNEFDLKIRNQLRILEK